MKIMALDVVTALCFFAAMGVPFGNLSWMAFAGVIVLGAISSICAELGRRAR